jgi:hypothetical protein
MTSLAKLSGCALSTAKQVPQIGSGATVMRGLVYLSNNEQCARKTELPKPARPAMGFTFVARSNP